jgi:2-amino-4-ketopentanoate thiolase alpha subunit
VSVTPHSATSDEVLPGGSWVEVQLTVLEAAGRAPSVPPDTARQDFVARVRGFLMDPARVGETADIRTLAGRTVHGTLTALNPRNPANFGDPVPALLEIGADNRSRIEGAS